MVLNSLDALYINSVFTDVLLGIWTPCRADGISCGLIEFTSNTSRGFDSN
jgi:hypothetical protein